MESGWGVFSDGRVVRCKYGTRLVDGDTGEEVPIVRKFKPGYTVGTFYKDVSVGEQLPTGKFNPDSDRDWVTLDCVVESCEMLKGDF